MTNQTTRTTIKIAFYHDGCTDGLFSAYGIWEKYKGSVLLIPVNYRKSGLLSTDEFLRYYLIDNFHAAKRFSAFGYELLDVSNAYRDIEIFFLDFAPDVEKLENLASIFKSVTVLDHHKSAMERYLEQYKTYTLHDNGVTIFPKGNVYVSFATDHCGAYATEIYFHGRRPIPYYIELVNDYDMWIKKDKNSDPFVAGIIAKHPRNIRELDTILNKEGIHKVIELGEVIQNTREKRSRDAAKRAIPVEVVHGERSYRAAFVNSNHDIASVLGHLLVDDSGYGYDIAVIYAICPTEAEGRGGVEAGCSVRSQKGTSSVFLAESFGGGGHDSASGFSAPLETVMTAITFGKLEIAYERESDPVAV